jgi:hypothetical protein
MAYGINSPIGLVPHSYLNGQPYTGALSSFGILSGTLGNIYIGDPVVLDGSGGIRRLAINTSTGADSASELQAATGKGILGVFAGCKYQAYVNGELSIVRSPYWTSGTSTFNSVNAEAMVVVAEPELLFDIQISTSLNASSGTPTLSTNYAGAASGIIGQYLTLGIGIINGSGNTGNTITAASAYYSDGTPLAANPTSGSFSTGLSAFYADVLSTGLGSTSGTGYHLQVIKLTERIDQVTYPNLWSGFASSVGINSATTPASISTGSFNNVLVRLNSRSI